MTLPPLFLFFNIALNRFTRNIACGTHKERTRPQAGEMAQMRKFLTRSPRCRAFESSHDSRWRIRGQAVEKQMHVVRHGFHCHHRPIVSLTDCVDQLFKPNFYLTYQHFASISWAENKMIVNQRHSGWSMAIILFHRRSVSLYSIDCNKKALHPTIKTVGFRAMFL